MRKNICKELSLFELGFWRWGSFLRRIFVYAIYYIAKILNVKHLEQWWSYQQSNGIYSDYFPRSLSLTAVYHVFNTLKSSFEVFSDWYNVEIWQNYKGGHLKDNELSDFIWKHFLHGKMTFLHWNKGEEMAPTIAGNGATLLVRRIPIPDPT